MRITIDRVNLWAKNSCPKWCKNKKKRDFYRLLIHLVVRQAERLPIQLENKRHSLAGEFWYNTYPWPYVSPEFADWEEIYTGEDRTLVTDESGCIVKHDTSYIAWKIRETTGYWPMETAFTKFSTLHWMRFLGNSDYKELAEKPSPGGKYVGIYPAEMGETVAFWYEATRMYEGLKDHKTVIVSTYRDKEFKLYRLNPSILTWVKIK